MGSLSRAAHALERSAPRLAAGFAGDGKSDATLRIYLTAVRHLVAWLIAEDELCEAGDVSRSHVRGLVAHLIDTRSAATANTNYRALRPFFKWLVNEEVITRSPMENTKQPKVAEKPIPVIPDHEMRRLLAACSGRSFLARRDEAIFRLLLDTGIRRAELIGLTVADVVSARFLHREFFTFKPQALISLVSNYRPTIAGTDDGIWERVLLIRWARKLEAHQRDPKLAEALRAEAPGILAWLVRGAVKYSRNGLQVPACIRRDRDGYRADQGTLDGFYGPDAVLRSAEQGSVPLKAAYEAYFAWADEEGHPERYRYTLRNLKTELENRGFAFGRTGGRQMYVTRNWWRRADDAEVDGCASPFVRAARYRERVLISLSG